MKYKTMDETIQIDGGRDPNEQGLPEFHLKVSPVANGWWTRKEVERLLWKLAAALGKGPEYWAFVREVADLRPDGEGPATDSPSDEDDPDYEAWVMENDDAVETLNGLIREARAILGEPEDQPERWQS